MIHQICWLAFALLTGSLQIIASALLLRERHLGPMLMLGGGILSLVAGTGTQVMIIIMNNTGNFKNEIIIATSALNAFGMLLFFTGLLLLALHRRGLAARITELETILNSQQENR